MSGAILKSGAIAFKSEGRILQELGLRLVASPEVALVELVKNSYDADATECNVSLSSDKKTLTIRDDGEGMTFADFTDKWMQVATSSKISKSTSNKFRRPLTGAKGLGRFAVRYLGDHLTLISTSFDKTRGYTTTLKAHFDWITLDKTSDLSHTKIPYELYRADSKACLGTSLIIKDLRESTDFVSSRDLRTEVLRIIDPIQGLDAGPFKRITGNRQVDPGFKVTLPGDSESKDQNLANNILSNYWARLTISLTNDILEYEVNFPGKKKPFAIKTKFSTSIRQGLFADIRFFPRRKGIFQDKSVDGRVAWNWVRENAGVAVVDRGFRIKPYGFRNNDWLLLDHDAAHNEREWRSEVSKKHYKISDGVSGNPALNPALNLATTYQLVGAVFIESARGRNTNDTNDLITAINREGLLDNDGYNQLFEVIRGGVEYLAHCDKIELNRLADIESKKIAISAREDIKKAITNIQKSESIASTDKIKIVKEYKNLADRLEDQEEYSSTARSGLLTMGMLGIVAGYMTHESDAMLHNLDKTLKVIKSLSVKHTELKGVVADIEKSIVNFKGYLSYSRLFIRKANNEKPVRFSAAGQVRHIVNHFGAFAEEHNILVEIDIAKDVMAPPVPVSAYSGILLNLFSNALKALISVQSSIKKPTICFRAWNDSGKHYIEVLDNGVGVPPELRKRIWDPLYTTTNDANPLGSGMGLGLTLVKQVVSELRGAVTVLPDPPEGYSTCFRIILPIK